MLLRIKNLLERNALGIAVLATLGIAALSLGTLPKLNLGFEVKSGDKYLHFASYLILSLLWYFALKKRLRRRFFQLLVPAALIIYGIILEGLQSGLTTYRTGDIYDALANSAGVVVGLLLFKRAIRWYDSI